MTVNRVTQISHEVTVESTPANRVTQISHEVTVESTPANRVTQISHEIIYEIDPLVARITQISAEVLVSASKARVTQISAEAVRSANNLFNNARVSQISAEAVVLLNKNVIIQVALEVIEDINPINSETLKLCLPFDETVGVSFTVDDSPSVHPIDMTTGGLPTIETTPSKFGGAAATLTTTDYLRVILPQPDFNFTADFTIEFWVYRNGTTDGHVMGQWPSSTEKSWRILFNGSSLEFEHTPDGSTVTTEIIPFTIPAVTWTHVVFEEFSGIFTVYIDGIAKYNVASFVPIYASNADLYIGKVETSVAGGALDISAGTADGVTLNADTQIGLLDGQFLFGAAIWFKPDGTRLFVMNYLGPATMYQFDLSTPWLLSSGILTDSFVLDSPPGTLDLGIGELMFNAAGTSFYLVRNDLGGGGPDGLYEFVLGTAWDLTTAAALPPGTPLVFGTGFFPQAISFGNNGLKLYFVDGDLLDTIHQWTLTIAYDVTTATDDSDTLGLKAITTLGAGGTLSLSSQLHFTDDGLTMIASSTQYDPGGVGSPNRGGIIQYTLSVAWDTSTCTHSFSLDLSDDTDTRQPFGLFFKPDFTKFYIYTEGNFPDRIHQYSLPSSGEEFNGIIDEMRIKVGEAVFQAPFFPPTGSIDCITVVPDISWEPGNLGEQDECESSEFKIIVTGLETVVGIQSFTAVGLPPGLVIDSNGNIFGTLPIHTSPPSVMNYEFQVTFFVGGTAFLGPSTFSFDVKDIFIGDILQVTVPTLFEDGDRTQWKIHLLNLIPNADQFLPAGDDFGITLTPRLFIMDGLIEDDIAAFQTAMASFDATVGGLPERNEIVIETLKFGTNGRFDVLYYSVNDTASTINSFANPLGISPNPIEPRSIDNIRDKLVAGVGFAGRSDASTPRELIPDWLSVYEPLIIAGFVEAGKGQGIVDKFDDDAIHHVFKGRTVILDRLDIRRCSTQWIENGESRLTIKFDDIS